MTAPCYFGPDWPELASAYGIKGYRAETEEEFKKAFDEALKSGKSAVTDAEINIDEMVLPMIPPGKPIDFMMMDIKD